MTCRRLVLVLGSLTLFACSNDGGGTGDGGSTSTTNGTDTSTGSTTVNPTTGITMTDGSGDGSTTSTSLVTTFDGSSSETGPMCELSVDGAYTECIGGQMPLGGFCPDGGCLTITGEMNYEVCNRGCATICNCWAPPDQARGEYTAEVACDNISAPSNDCEAPGANCSCFLDCGGGKTCPPGAECVGLQSGAEICAFFVDVPSTSTDSGTDSGSDSGTGTDSGSSSGSTSM